MSEQPTPKKPWLAALLSIWPLPIGIGYIYVDRWGRFATAVLLQIALLTLLAMLGLRAFSSYAAIGLVILTAIDAHSIASHTQPAPPNDPIT